MSSKIAGHRPRLDFAIEACWLVALAVVPIAFSGQDVVVFFLQPKDFVLHLTALLIASLWGFEWALSRYRQPVDFGSWSEIRRWLGWNPRNWALAAAAGFGVAAIFSTILSPLPAVSLWGRDFSQLGYELYSVLSFLVIFFAIALRVREPGQVKRILLVIAGAGALTALYGISQRFGWDPIGNGEGQVRVFSSFGNPIFFGSYLLMSVVVTLGLSLDADRRDHRWWLPLMALIIGVQLAALWFTGSRGPWLGTLTGLAAFGVLGAITLERSQITRGGATSLAGLLIAMVIVNLPGDPSGGESRGLGSVVSGVNPVADGFGGRTNIWVGSVRLLDSWEGQVAESAALSALRPVIGLGPEMYYYSFPLAANPQNGVVLVSHAHNYPLHELLELGIAGFSAFVVMVVAVLITGLGFIRNRGRADAWLVLAMVAIMAGLIGRAVEQMPGVARVSDLLVFWALLGVALAIYSIGRKTRASAPQPAASTHIKIAYVPVAAAAILALAALTIFISRDVQLLRSGLAAADAIEESAAGNRPESIRLLKRASDISPNVQQYYVWSGELLIEEALASGDRSVALALIDDAYNTFIEFEMRDSQAYTTQLRMGRAISESIITGDNSRRDELVVRSLSTADSMPSYPKVQSVLAERMLIAGRADLGLELADRAIAMEEATSSQPFAWFLKGDALRGLGDTSGALDAFTASLDRDPESIFAPAAHRAMALVYDSLGNFESAGQHRAFADEIELATGE